MNSQECINESCIAQVIKYSVPARRNYSHHLVRMLVSLQFGRAMAIITQEAIS